MAVTSQFVKYPNVGMVEIADGDAAEVNNYNGANSITVFTAGSKRAAKTLEVVTATEGARVERFLINSQGQINACIVRIFIENAAGTVIKLYREILVAVNSTASATAAGTTTTSEITGGLVMEPGDKLKVSVSVLSATQKITIMAFGGDF